MIIQSAFKPAWWLTNAHAQTMYATIARHTKATIDKMERFELPDGDFIDLAWSWGGLSNDTPLVIFLHGLGGGVDSRYVAGQMAAFNRCGWRAVLMHFRGAGREPNRMARAYHSGDTADLNCFLQALSIHEPHTRKAAVGVSMGGNVLLKWLGENPNQQLIHAAIGISVPFELRLVSDRINQGFSRIYQAHLLKRLRTIFKRKMQMHAQVMPISLERLDTLNCFWTFDEFVTAPLHGFSHVHAYYKQASSRQYLKHITTPTLLIHALDDPFMTPNVLPKIEELSSQLTLEISDKGGHVGFITGSVPGKPTYWLDARTPEFLSTYLSR